VRRKVVDSSANTARHRFSYKVVRGFVGAIALARAMQAMLFNVNTFDRPTLVGTVGDIIRHCSGSLLPESTHAGHVKRLLLDSL
jgi:hypothetical protein